MPTDKQQRRSLIGDPRGCQVKKRILKPTSAREGEGERKSEKESRAGGSGSRGDDDDCAAWARPQEAERAASATYRWAHALSPGKRAIIRVVTLRLNPPVKAGQLPRGQQRN